MGSHPAVAVWQFVQDFGRLAAIAVPGEPEGVAWFGLGLVCSFRFACRASFWALTGFLDSALLHLVPAWSSIATSTASSPCHVMLPRRPAASGNRTKRVLSRLAAGEHVLLGNTEANLAHAFSKCLRLH